MSSEENKMPEDDELKLEDIELSELEAEMPLEESVLMGWTRQYSQKQSLRWQVN